MQRKFREVWSFLLLVCVSTAVAAEDSVVIEPGVRIHYVEQGPQHSDIEVLLVPGWAFSADVWEGQIRVLREKHRVVAIDPRSQGRSTVTADGNTPEVRASDIDRVIETLNLRNVLLVGWSQGVQDVLSHAAQFGPDRIAGYVLVDSMPSAGPNFVEHNPTALKQLLGRMGLYSAHQKPYLQGMMRAIFAQPLEPARAERFLTSAMKTPTTTGMAMLISDLLTVDRRPYVSKLVRPTLIVASATAEDLEAQRAMLRDLPDGRMVEIAQAGHALFVDRADEFNIQMLGFIRDLAVQ